MSHKYATLKMRQIHRNVNQPRKTFDEDALNELAESIKEHGLLQPIVVRKVDEGYELVAGERRFRASELADKITIEAKILLPEGESEISDMDSFKKAMAENLNREDMLPLEEARGFKKVLDEEEGATPASVAKTFSKSVQFVNQRLALLALRPEIQAAVDLGHIGTQAAVQIAALSKDNQKAVFQDWKKGDKNDNQLVHIAYAMRKQEKAATQDSMVDVDEMTPEEKAERSRAQAKTKSDLDAIEGMWALLDSIGKADPMELARTLAGEVGKRLEQMDRVADVVQKARFQLRQAKAHADASEIMVNPAAAAPDLVAEADAVLAQLDPAAGDAEPETQAEPAPETEAEAAMASDEEAEGEPAPAADVEPESPAEGDDTEAEAAAEPVAVAA
ncbi:ParB/RepB/Spo0J family partition protein [Streptomyces ipomoeae]|uniref:ParB/RepB/Spo0J family partition protein n=1 Tax=Streptomyces ipomoeae TaxID=103232 RepID=UPI0029BB9367|nr:ParB/RepB/Spo0J family partition protein [Streptomyces ipomoeae]MDX2820485.1 ParB/RepB/Spo0J family partition protein [Streptomyces ipomoeae]MDX2874805.1 ParB/RepB/Spo0J family partition protein [Streptomyces ipomoeae]